MGGVVAGCGAAGVADLLASALWTWPLLWWHHSRLRAHVTAEVERMHTSMIKHQCETEETPL